MEDNKITREVYKQYANKIVSVLGNESFYEQFKNRVDKGSSVFKLAKKRLIQDISIDWIDTIEGILPNLDTIVRNPRKFIVQEEDIVDVSLARSISTESVKFLAQHTNMISKVDEKTGDVTPSKILNITKEESFEIYENRFIYTLLLKLKDFVTMRYDKIKKASATQDVLELDVESRFNLPSKKVTYRTEYYAQLSFDEVMRLDPDTLTKIERVAKIDRIITDFLSSSFAKSMRNSAPVRPPIMRTNVILKEPNFKKALTLWQFIETYQQTGGFSTSDEVEDYPIDTESEQRLRSMVTLNTMVFESLYDQCETNFDMDDKEFADFLRVGNMDFEKDQIDRDEYAQKLEEQKENEEEQDNIQEVKPEENEEADKEIPPETPPEPEEEKQPEQEPEKEVEKEIEKPQEIETEVVVERPVEVERFKEMPPKADQEEVDLEPDAEKFDQHLFEVRKIFKRPDDDKIKQEEIIKVKDAIDRCLNSYRRIKQEELEERDRQERIRRRKEDIQKRAEAFKKQREEIEKNLNVTLDGETLGMDPFSFQKAKIAMERKKAEDEKRLAELKAQQEAENAKKAQEKGIEFDKNENLELDDKDTESINKSIEEMEKDRLKRAERNDKIDNALDAIDAVSPLEGDVPLVARAKTKGKIELPKDEESPEIAKEDNSETKKSEKDDEHKKRHVDLTPVDENKVAVGELHLKDDGSVTPWGDGANLGNLEHNDENKPKRKYTRKAKPAQSVEETAAKASEIVQEAPETEQEADQIEEIKPVSEMHINLGGKVEDTQGMGISFKNENSITPWGDGAKLGNLEHKDENKPKRKYTRRKKAENEAETVEKVIESEKENVADTKDVKSEDIVQSDGKAEKAEGIASKAQESAEKSEQNGENENKPTIRKAPREKKNPWDLSATTLNQKYTTPSGKKRKIDAVDENKVSVGGITFADGSGIVDPFGDTLDISAKPENHDDEE